MPFMKGKQPIRRTIEYLCSGKLALKDRIKIFSINYNTFGDHHKGTRNYVFWNLPQLQYRNPNVQIVTFKNMTPTPFIRCYYDNGEQMLIDCDSKEREEIEEHLMKIVGKSAKVLMTEAKLAEKQDNPANFGFGCDKQCVCEIPGQVPCPSIIPLPFNMRGKYKYKKK